INCIIDKYDADILPSICSMYYLCRPKPAANPVTPTTNGFIAPRFSGIPVHSLTLFAIFSE
ncbi:MAG: hypothetical protein KKD33_09370, partial [Verrucomicrobia bacterium]|nr:hypothetical protein [Verrucomicrobiota bacterium]